MPRDFGRRHRKLRSGSHRTRRHRDHESVDRRSLLHHPHHAARDGNRRAHRFDHVLDRDLSRIVRRGGGIVGGTSAQHCSTGTEDEHATCMHEHMRVKRLPCMHDGMRATKVRIHATTRWNDEFLLPAGGTDIRSLTAVTLICVQSRISASQSQHSPSLPPDNNAGHVLRRQRHHVPSMSPDDKEPRGLLVVRMDERIHAALNRPR